MTDIYKLLFIISCIGAAKPRIWELAQHFDSFDDMYDVLMSPNAHSYFSPSEIKAAARTKRQHIEAVSDHCLSNKITILTYDDSRYPDRLRRLLNPPALLFCKGDVSILKDDVIIAAVGARKISGYTEKAETKLVAELASKGITIASGFAAGADILANRTAVKNGGRTIAVLGSGIGYSYPPENMQYVDEILKNGVIISEYFPNASAQLLNFTARNRILAALSSGIAIMEASERSGSLNIAQQGQNQGKDIWVMSVHDITDSRYDGGKELLRSGAFPIYGAEDILGEYFENTGVRPIKEMTSDYSILNDKNTGEASDRKPLPKKTAKAPEPIKKETVPELNEIEKTVYDILSKSPSPLSADEISEDSGEDLFEILDVITGLELRGTILSDDGQTYYLN
ncbi:MAG: DNA-processing protein DprA [Oscillospiraceae bacterium]|nr:DNA-processing protein DprA [Oscillospiraceae bacterium]